MEEGQHLGHQHGWLEVPQVIPNGVAGHDELHLVMTDWAADMFGIHMNVLSERLINEYQK